MKAFSSALFLFALLVIFGVLFAAPAADSAPKAKPTLAKDHKKVASVHKKKMNHAVTLKARTVFPAHFELAESGKPDNETQIAEAAAEAQKYFSKVILLLDSLSALFGSDAKEDEKESADAAKKLGDDNNLDEAALRAKVEDETVTQHLFGLSVQAEIVTPAQLQEIVINTLGGHFFVASDQVRFSRYIPNPFVEQDSTTLKKTNEQFKLKFSESSASGDYVHDVVKFGGYKVEGHKLGVADSVSYFFPLLHVNGILGIGRSDDGTSALGNLLANANKEQYLTLFHNPIVKPFSLYANEVRATFGGWDHNLCQNDWKTVKAEDKGAWKVQIDSVTVGTYDTIKENSATALVISTVPMTFLPHDTFKKLARAVGAIEVKKYGVYMAFCFSLPTIHLSINGQKIPLRPEHYAIKISGVCFLKMAPLHEVYAKKLGVDYILAENLMRSNCVRFSPSTKEIAFATPIPVDEPTDDNDDKDKDNQ